MNWSREFESQFSLQLDTPTAYVIIYNVCQETSKAIFVRKAWLKVVIFSLL